MLMILQKHCQSTIQEELVDLGENESQRFHLQILGTMERVIVVMIKTIVILGA